MPIKIDSLVLCRFEIETYLTIILLNKTKSLDKGFSSPNFWSNFCVIQTTIINNFNNNSSVTSSETRPC